MSLILCQQCKKNKNEDEFFPSSIKKSDFTCKKCKVEQRKSNNQNLTYFSCIIFRHQKAKDTILYTKEEFIKWVRQNTEFKTLFKSWLLHNKNGKRPTLIRIDPKKPYSFDNLKVIELQNLTELCSRAKSRKVSQLDLEGNLIATYPNARIAAEMLGFKVYSGINGACRGSRKTAYGFRWKYN